MQRRVFLSSTIALSLAACARRKREPMFVEDQQDISQVPGGPPPGRTEIQPPRPDGDVVWIGGRWKWQDNDWVWQPGHYVAKPYRNAIWVAGKWQQRGHGWIWVPGHWI